MYNFKQIIKYTLTTLVIIITIFLLGCTESNDNIVETTPTAIPTMPENLNQEAVKFILGETVSGYTYDVEIITLLNGTEAPGKKNIFITYHYAFHDWLQHEYTGTEIVSKLYTSQYNNEINGITIYFQKNEKNLAKLTLDKMDANKYTNEWDDIMWLKRSAWTDSYFDPSIKMQE